MPDRHPVDELLHRSADVEIPADVERRMRQEFSEFRRRLDRRRPPLVEWAAWLFGLRTFRWAVTAAVVTIVLATVFPWSGAGGGHVYAAGASRLAGARSVRYTVDLAPSVSVEFSLLAPARERVRMSWGIEIRSDGSSTQLVLLHGSKQYLREPRGSGEAGRTPDLIEQLTSLPRTADAALGEQTVGGRRLVGYRVTGSRIPGKHGAESLDLWIDSETGAPDHVDITPVGAGSSGYKMHIRDIRLDEDLDPSSFDMEPPAGYSDARSANLTGLPAPDDGSTTVAPMQPEVAQAREQSAVVIRRSGSYGQAAGAVEMVSRYLRERGIVPEGEAFGRFESEWRWEVGYPVPPGTTAESPFQVVTLPGGPVASLVVEGAWGHDSAGRWTRLLVWLGEHGYSAVGPPTEIWSGDSARPGSQVTELRIAVARAGR